MRHRCFLRTLPKLYALDTRRFSQPNVRNSPKVRIGARKNLVIVDGRVMTCTGCGSDSQFYIVGTNLDKMAYQTKRLTEFAKLNSRKQRQHITLYFLQLNDARISQPENIEDAENDDIVASEEDLSENNIDNRRVRFDLEDAQSIANRLDTRLEESIFVGTVQEDGEEDS